MPKTAADHHKLRHTSSWQMPNISWKAKVVIGLLGTLTLLQVVNAGWVWWERRRLSSLITREFALRSCTINVTYSCARGCCRAMCICVALLNTWLVVGCYSDPG